MKVQKLIASMLPRLASHTLKNLIAFAETLGLSIRIVTVSGGPCAGKTECMLRIEEDFGKRGFKVILLPEAATIVRNAGFRSEEGFFTSLSCQKMMVRLNEHFIIEAVTAAIENHVEGTEKKILIVRDRSSLDGCGYVESHIVFESLISDLGLSIADISISHADIFLRSLGFDKPGLYRRLSHNNPARFENAEQAGITDRRLLDIYSKYGHCTVIDNRGSLERKKRRVIAAIADALGEPRLEKEMSFIVKATLPELLHALNLEMKDPVSIRQFYMPGGDRYRRIVYPGGMHAKYVHTEKVDTGKKGVRIERETLVTASDFVDAEGRRDFDLAPIDKSRYAYVRKIGSGYYTIEIDVFDSGLPSSLIRVEVEYGTRKPKVEPLFAGLNFVNATGRRDCSNSSIAAGLFPENLFD